MDWDEFLETAEIAERIASNAIKAGKGSVRKDERLERKRRKRSRRKHR